MNVVRQPVCVWDSARLSVCLPVSYSVCYLNPFFLIADVGLFVLIPDDPLLRLPLARLGGHF